MSLERETRSDLKFKRLCNATTRDNSFPTAIICIYRKSRNTHGTWTNIVYVSNNKINLNVCGWNINKRVGHITPEARRMLECLSEIPRRCKLVTSLDFVRTRQFRVVRAVSNACLRRVFVASFCSSKVSLACGHRRECCVKWWTIVLERQSVRMCVIKRDVPWYS